MAKTSPRVFVRDATGLVREFGSWDSFAFNYGGIVTVVGLSTLFVSFNVLSGTNVLVALLLILPILIAYSVADTQLGIAMPRSGGDYVYVSRILHPAIGLAASILLVFLLILNPAIFSDLITTGYAPGLFTAFGWTAQASMLSDTTVRLVIDNIIMGIAILLVIFPVRFYSKMQTLFVGLALIGSILVPIALGALGHDGFVALFNAKSSISYSAVVTQAESMGYAPHFSWTDTILTLPGLSFFLVTNWPCVVGGELKSVKKSMTIGVVGGVMFAWLMFFVTAALYYYVLGSDFAGSVAYLVQNSPSNAPFGGTNVLTSIIQYMYGTDTALGVAVTVVITASLIAACFIVIAQSVLLSTRHIFAWAFDKIIPSKFADINDRFGTPVFTTIALWIISEIVLLVTIYQSSAIAVLTNAGLAESLGYGPALVAALFFARRRKSLFEGSPSTTKIKVGGIYLITLLGAIGALGFATIVVFVAAYPIIGFPITTTNILFLIAVFLSGGVLYYAAKYYRKGQGIDIDVAFGQIPPE